MCVQDESTGLEFLPKKNRYYIGEEVVVECQEGYGLQGESNSIQCVSSQNSPWPVAWVPPVPKCTVRYRSRFNESEMFLSCS